MTEEVIPAERAAQPWYVTEYQEKGANYYLHAPGGQRQLLLSCFSALALAHNEVRAVLKEAGKISPDADTVLPDMLKLLDKGTHSLKHSIKYLDAVEEFIERP